MARHRKDIYKRKSVKEMELFNKASTYIAHDKGKPLSKEFLRTPYGLTVRK